LEIVLALTLTDLLKSQNIYDWIKLTSLEDLVAFPTTFVNPPPLFPGQRLNYSLSSQKRWETFS